MKEAHNNYNKHAGFEAQGALPSSAARDAAGDDGRSRRAFNSEQLAKKSRTEPAGTRQQGGNKQVSIS